eukprot:jgi/Psemu1/190970/e_gw1.108.84.1
MGAPSGADLKALAIKSLVTAVETSNPSGGDEFNCQELCKLFQPSKRCDALVAGHTIKQQQTLLWNALKNCSTDKNSKNQLKRFFSGLYSIVERIIEEEGFVPESIKEKGNNDGNDSDNDMNDEDVKPDKKSDDCLVVLKCASLAVRAFLDGRIIRKKEKEAHLQRRVALKVPPQVLQLASALHETLFPLHSCGSPAGAAKSAILSLCETWWLSEAEHRESLIAQCLPLLVLNASDESIDAFTTKSHIQRLYKLRNAFSCIDFADPSSDSLRQLLLRVASNPVCLQMPEGRKFLAALLQQDVHLVQDLHRAFRVQIPEAKPSILKSYGEIYHRAWKEEQEEIMSIRQAIEFEVLQDLMYSVINMESQITFRSVLTVLEPLHADKKNKEVASLLHRLYSPILWRSLAATNPLTRKNAVIVLEKVFPLQDPLNSLSMKDAVLKATDALQIALQDDDPAVRLAASGATAKTCAMFWEILPPREIRLLLNHIVVNHSSDSRSSAVRAGALDAITTLLGTKQSHGVLRALLPSLGNLIHDKTEKVRLAAVRMLLEVKKCPAIRFYHVVPVDHLMARFVEEEKLHANRRNAMAKELTALMLSSYFPQGENVSANKLLQRTISFLLTDPSAASVFYANLVDHIEVESLVKFIIMLLKCLKTCVNSDQAKQVKKSTKMKKRRRGTTAGDSDAEIDSASTDTSCGLSADNTSLMAGLVEIINTLWDSLTPLLEKPKNEAPKKVLEDRFTKNDCLVDIMAHFEQKGLESLAQGCEDDSRPDECFRTCSSMLDCAARLDQNLTRQVIAFATSSLASLSKEESESVIPLVTAHLSFLCKSQFVEDVTEALARSIEANAMEDVTLLSPNFEATLGLRRSPRSSSASMTNKNDVVPFLPNFISWGVLEYVLQGANSQGRAIRQAILSSNSATRTMEKALEKGIKLSELLLADDSVARNYGNQEIEYAIRTSEAYGRFELHRESSLVLEKDDSTSMDRQVGKLLLWTSNKIVPAFMRSDDEGASALRDCDLSSISNRLSISMVHSPPRSPSLKSPLKQKANCGSTPVAMRGRSSLFLTTPNVSPVIYSAKVGGALLLSSCILSSEMLAMGMTNADEISKAAVGWCQIFDQSRWPVEEELIHAFIRLAIQLFRASGDVALLEDLLVKCNDHFKGSFAGEVMKKELQLLLRLRKGIDNLLPAFFGVSKRIIGSGDLFISFESTCSSDDIWSEGGSIEIFFDAIRGNSGAMLSFAEEIVKRLLECEGEVNDTVNFNAKCLSFVMKEAGGQAMTQIISKLDVAQTEKDGAMRSLFENLLECTA